MSALEKQQQQKLANKYGGLPSKKNLMNKRMKGQAERTFFDSADHFSGKETGSQTKQPANLNSVTEETHKDDTTSTATGEGGQGSTTTATASGVEATQAAKLSNKYGGLPSKKNLMNKRMKGQNERTFFDSADHFSGKETGSSQLKGNPAMAHLKK